MSCSSAPCSPPFFSSIQTTLTRVMDPNEYDSLLSTLVADFENINSEIIDLRPALAG